MPSTGRRRSTRRAAAAAPHASPSLIAAALPAIAPHCTCRELVRLTAACHELRKVELTELGLNHLTRLEDLSPLAKLIGLHTLRLTWCRAVSDITPLGRLVALEVLELVMMDVADIAPLANCAALTALQLTGFAVEQVRALAALPRLKSLTLADCNQLTDVSPLARCPSLEALNLTSCMGLRGDLTALGNECTSLRSLNVRSTQLTCSPREGLDVIFA